MSSTKAAASENLNSFLDNEMAPYLAYVMAFLVFVRLVLVKYNLISRLFDWYRRASATSLDVVQNFDLHGKYAIVTGACRTIGYETAAALCARGCHVVLACQLLADGERAVERIKKRYPSAQCVAMQLDLLSFESVRKFAEAYLARADWKLHYLVLNAGVWHWTYKTTEDGWNGVVQINYLSHWYLTRLLTPRLIESAPSRVLVVSSWNIMFRYFSACGDTTTFDDDSFRLSPKHYNPSHAYSSSKVFNALFAKELNQRLRDRGVTAYSIHPGWVRTQIWSQVAFFGFVFKLGTYLLFPLSKSASQGGSTTLYCALTRGLESQSGAHFEDCSKCKMPAWFDGSDLHQKLWKVTENTLNTLDSEDSAVTHERKTFAHKVSRQAQLVH